MPPDHQNPATADGLNDVTYRVEIDGLEADLVVQSVNIDECLSQLSEAAIEIILPGDNALEEEELLSKDVTLTVDRGEELEQFRGLINRAHISPAHDRRRYLTIHVVPALWLLTETLDSRIYQDLTVPDLVKELVSELLGDRGRTVRDDELLETYSPHEYLVQHRESHYAFLRRLCSEEGIFFYFDNDDEGQSQEVLVLGDSNSNRPLVREDDEGVVVYEHNDNQIGRREVAFAVERSQRVGATDSVLRGFDWTRPGLNVHDERTERADWQGPRLEVYDHHHSLRHHDYDEGDGSYQAHSASTRSRMHAERLDLSRSGGAIETTVISARPGHILDLQGAGSHDGRYLIVSAAATGHGDGTSGQYRNRLDVVPVSMPYRPPVAARPPMPGPETATVVGPAGEEIHTDQHGRIKVQFHWDRQGQRDERSSVWIRVSHAWAGAGWGTIFIPRIGMEVIVSFLGGDPDRPMVTGCVYNGDNRVPYPLPENKTRSTIKTNSSLGGGGYNELRFEDKAGSEEVFIHAQKDFNEVVEHCHSTHVKVDQSNTVDHDQTETIGHDQTLHVVHDRKKNVDNDEQTEVGGNRTEEVTGHEQIHIHQWRKTKIDLDEKLVVHGDRKMMVDGRDDEHVDGGREVVVSEFDNHKVINGANLNAHVSGQYNITVDGAHYTLVQGGSEKITQGSEKTYVESGTEIHAKTGSSHLLMKNDGKILVKGDTKIELEVGSCKIEMAGGKITISAGASSIELGPSGVTTSGPKVTSSAQTINEITGLMVKLN